MSQPNYRPIARALSDEDVHRLRHTTSQWLESSAGSNYDLAQQHRNRAIILTLINSGMTLQEISALHTRDLHVGHTLTITAGISRRTITIDDVETRSALSRWLVLRKLACNMSGGSPLPANLAVFTSRRLEPIRTSALQRLLEQLRRDSGIEFDMFNIRHTFIVNKLRENHSPAAVSKMLGRASPEVVELYAAMNVARLTGGKPPHQVTH